MSLTRRVVRALAFAVSASALLASTASAQRPARPTQLPPAAKPDIPKDLTETSPTGLTADEVGTRAIATSYSAKAQQEALEAAAARVDQAWVSFLPRLGGVVRYTRISDFTPQNLLSVPAGVNQVLTTQPPSTPGGVPAGTLLSAPVPVVAFPPILDNYLLEANIAIPLSDYFLRIGPAYAAASNTRDAAQYDLYLARIKAMTDGQVAFYTWLRARGAAVVALQADYDQRAHLVDANNQFNVGGASRADVLRAETSVAAAGLQVQRTKDLVDLCEKQVRFAIHVRGTGKLVPAESLDSPLPPVSENLSRLIEEALSSRFEVKSLQANADAAHGLAVVARASMFPTVSAFGQAVYANPNVARIPLTDQWFPTWSAGVQLTWSPTEALGGFWGGRIIPTVQHRSSLSEAPCGTGSSSKSSRRFKRRTRAISRSMRPGESWRAPTRRTASLTKCSRRATSRAPR